MESCRDPPAEELVQTIDGVIRDGRLDGNLPTPSRRVEPKGKSLLSLGLTIAVLMLAFVGVRCTFVLKKNSFSTCLSMDCMVECHLGKGWVRLTCPSHDVHAGWVGHPMSSSSFKK